MSKEVLGQLDRGQFDPATQLSTPWPNYTPPKIGQFGPRAQSFGAQLSGVQLSSVQGPICQEPVVFEWAIEHEHFSISFSYYRAIETFVQQLRKEKGTSWTHLNDPNIWCKQVAQKFLQNNICYFRSTISPWRGPKWKSLFRAFYLRMAYIFTMPKISLRWGPLQPFLNIDHDFDNICFLKKLWKKIGTKFGS